MYAGIAFILNIFMLANHIRTTSKVEPKYHVRVWLKSKYWNPMIARCAKITILIRFIAKKAAPRNRREYILFFNGIGVAIFNINRRKYAEPATHGGIILIARDPMEIRLSCKRFAP